MTIINYIVIIPITILFLFMTIPPIFWLLTEAWERWKEMWKFFTG